MSDEKNKANDDMFNDYLDAGAPEPPKIAEVSETVYQRLFDVTFGYLISSAAAFFFLLFIMPVFYLVYFTTAAGSGRNPSFTEVMGMLNPGWLLSLALTAGFFFGGVALFNSVRAGRALIKYLFLAWGLIMAFELYRFIDAGGYQTSPIAAPMTTVCVIAAGLLFLAYRSYKRHDVELMVFLNAVAAAANVFVIVKHLFSYNSFMYDRYVVYITMFFIAAILMQTSCAVAAFFPLGTGGGAAMPRLGTFRRTLLIVIALAPLAALYAVSEYYPYLFHSVGKAYYDDLGTIAAKIEDMKKQRVKDDCNMLAREIRKFNKYESGKVTSADMNELEKGYVKDIHKLKDSWGNAYIYDATLGVILSKGPDGRHAAGPAIPRCNHDDIKVSSTEPLTLIDAKLEINPAGGDYRNPAEASKCYDVLHLYFNRDVDLPRTLNLAHYLRKSDYGSYIDDREPGMPVRYAEEFLYYDTRESYIGTIEAPEGLLAGAGGLSKGMVASTREYGRGWYDWGADSREIVIRFADGHTIADPSKKLLVPGVHYINLAGSIERRNNKFKEFGRPGYTHGAVEAAQPVLIKRYK